MGKNTDNRQGHKACQQVMPETRKPIIEKGHATKWLFYQKRIDTLKRKQILLRRPEPASDPY